MKKSILIRLIISIISCISAQLSFGYAHTKLMLENNCNTDVIFTVNENNNTILKKTLRPNQYYTTKELTNDNFIFSTTSYYQISYNSQQSSGSVESDLSNSFFYLGEKGANRILFKNAKGNIEINHRLHNNGYEYYWTNYSVNVETLVNDSLIIPTFTVSACHKRIDVSNSLLFGVKRVLIFGDSLSDNGNLYKYTLQLLPKSTPYYRGMFSNGEVWSEQFANRLVLNNITVSNYAVGGSSVIVFPEWADNSTPYVLDSQVGLYLNLEAKDDLESNLAIFFVGGNDYLTTNPQTIEVKKAVKQVTDGIFNAIEQVNIKKTVIVGLPDLSITGESKSLQNQRVLKEIYKLHNNILKQYAKVHGYKYIDIAEVFNELINNTQSFNKKYHAEILDKQTIGSCWLGGYFISKKLDGTYSNLKNDESSQTSLSNIKMNDLLNLKSLQSSVSASYSGSMCNHPQHFAFWDHVHPTYQVHRALYEYIIKELGAESITKEN